MKKIFKKIVPNRGSWIGFLLGFLISIPIILVVILAQSTSKPSNHQLSWLYYPLAMAITSYELPMSMYSLPFIIISDTILLAAVLQFAFYGYFLGKSISQKKFSITIIKIIALHFLMFFLGLVIIKPYWINQLYGPIPIISENVTFIEQKTEPFNEEEYMRELKEHYPDCFKETLKKIIKDCDHKK